MHDGTDATQHFAPDIPPEISARLPHRRGFWYRSTLHHDLFGDKDRPQ